MIRHFYDEIFLISCMHRHSELKIEFKNVNRVPWHLSEMELDTERYLLPPSHICVIKCKCKYGGAFIPGRNPIQDIAKPYLYAELSQLIFEIHKEMLLIIPLEIGPCTFCPITKRISIDNVELPCGHIFDREGIDNWFRTRRCCPLCNTVVPSRELLQANVQANQQGQQSQLALNQIGIELLHRRKYYYQLMIDRLQKIIDLMCHFLGRFLSQMVPDERGQVIGQLINQVYYVQQHNCYRCFNCKEYGLPVELDRILQSISKISASNAQMHKSKANHLTYSELIDIFHISNYVGRIQHYVPSDMTKTYRYFNPMINLKSIDIYRFDNSYQNWSKDNPIEYMFMLLRSLESEFPLEIIEMIMALSM